VTSVGTHGLKCLTDDDYGAFALLMQSNAAATNSALSGQSTALGTYSNRPWLWSANSSAINIATGAGTSLPPNGDAGAEQTPFGSTFINNGMPNPGVFNFFPSGVYLVGSSINWTVATPNNGTLRTLEVYGVRDINGFTSSTVTYTALAQQTTREGSAGGTGSLCVSSIVVANGPTDLRILAAGFFHSNTSSVLVIPVGGWQLWYMYLGSGVVT
jgi:hypothetical protein